jgi:hypothetical protein
VTLSNDVLLKVLKTQFVCGFKNIKGEPYAGKSGQHDPDSPAVLTTNGAGPHNVQIFLLSPDGTVLHCLPGYWAPADLLLEMQFARSLEKVWQNPNLSVETKRKLFREANLQHMASHPLDMRQRSHLQNFDAKEEHKKASSDFTFKTGDYHPPVAVASRRKMMQQGDLKAVDQVVHERMAQRPFLSYEEFDVEKFSDYGKMRYDKHEADPSKKKDQGKGKKQ